MNATPNSGPMIVQSDLSVLLDVHASRFEEAREALGTFALLEKSPEHLHTYRITPLSLWNAAAAGLTPDDVVASLSGFTRYDLPRDIPFIVKDTMARFGALVLIDAKAESPEA
ncbi:MAG: helicase-associated domain-containing protein, partial [Candidatus Hydrogenedentales bacterium]